MKTCFKCNREIPLTEFYKHPQMGDGRLGKCKDCAKRDVSENYHKRKPHYQAYERSRLHNPERVAARKANWQRAYAENPEKIQEQQRQWCKRNSHKRRAQIAAKNAVRDGRLIRKPCERCGNQYTQGHHEDYAKPLDVVWLCTRCHADRHMELRDQGIEL